MNTETTWRHVRPGMEVRGADGRTYNVIERGHFKTAKGRTWLLTRAGTEFQFTIKDEQAVTVVGQLPEQVQAEIDATRTAEDLRVDPRHVAMAMVLNGFPSTTIEADGDHTVPVHDPQTIACPTVYKEAGSLASHLSILHGVAAPNVKQTDLRSLRETHDFYHDRGDADAIEPGGRAHVHDDPLYLSRFINKSKEKGS